MDLLERQKVFHERFIANLLRRAQTIIRAYLFEEENGIDSARQVELDENVENETTRTKDCSNRFETIT